MSNYLLNAIILQSINILINYIFRVYKTQYCCWRSWSKREKIFLLIIVILTGAIMGLIVGISIKDGDNNSTLGSQLPWALVSKE